MKHPPCERFVLKPSPRALTHYRTGRKPPPLGAQARRRRPAYGGLRASRSGAASGGGLRPCPPALRSRALNGRCARGFSPSVVSSVWGVCRVLSSFSLWFVSWLCGRSSRPLCLVRRPLGLLAALVRPWASSCAVLLPLASAWLSASALAFRARVGFLLRRVCLFSLLGLASPSPLVVRRGLLLAPCRVLVPPPRPARLVVALLARCVPLVRCLLLVRACGLTPASPSVRGECPPEPPRKTARVFPLVQLLFSFHSVSFSRRPACRRRGRAKLLQEKSNDSRQRKNRSTRRLIPPSPGKERRRARRVPRAYVPRDADRSAALSTRGTSGIPPRKFKMRGGLPLPRRPPAYCWHVAFALFRAACGAGPSLRSVRRAATSAARSKKHDQQTHRHLFLSVSRLPAGRREGATRPLRDSPGPSSFGGREAAQVPLRFA